MKHLVGVLALILGLVCSPALAGDSLFVKFAPYRYDKPESLRPSDGWEAVDAFLAASPDSLYDITFVGRADSATPSYRTFKSGTRYERPMQRPLNRDYASFRAEAGATRAGRGTLRTEVVRNRNERGLLVVRTKKSRPPEPLPSIVNSYYNIDSSTTINNYALEQSSQLFIGGHISKNAAGETYGGVNALYQFADNLTVSGKVDLHRGRAITGGIGYTFDLILPVSFLGGGRIIDGEIAFALFAETRVRILGPLYMNAWGGMENRRTETKPALTSAQRIENGQLVWTQTFNPGGVKYTHNGFYGIGLSLKF